MEQRQRGLLSARADDLMEGCRLFKWCWRASCTRGASIYEQGLAGRILPYVLERRRQSLCSWAEMTIALSTIDTVDCTLGKFRDRHQMRLHPMVWARRHNPWTGMSIATPT